MEELMTIEELSDFLKISKSGIYNLIYRKKIPHVKIGQRVRFQRKTIEKWLENSTNYPLT